MCRKFINHGTFGFHNTRFYTIYCLDRPVDTLSWVGHQPKHGCSIVSHEIKSILGVSREDKPTRTWIGEKPNGNLSSALEEAKSAFFLGAEPYQIPFAVICVAQPQSLV